MEPNGETPKSPTAAGERRRRERPFTCSNTVAAAMLVDHLQIH